MKYMVLIHREVVLVADRAKGILNQACFGSLPTAQQLSFQGDFSRVNTCEAAGTPAAFVDEAFCVI